MLLQVVSLLHSVQLSLLDRVQAVLPQLLHRQTHLICLRILPLLVLGHPLDPLLLQVVLVDQGRLLALQLAVDRPLSLLGPLDLPDQIPRPLHGIGQAGLARGRVVVVGLRVPHMAWTGLLFQEGNGAMLPAPVVGSVLNHRILGALRCLLVLRQRQTLHLRVVHLLDVLAIVLDLQPLLLQLLPPLLCLLLQVHVMCQHIFQERRLELAQFLLGFHLSGLDQFPFVFSLMLSLLEQALCFLHVTKQVVVIEF